MNQNKEEKYYCGAFLLHPKELKDKQHKEISSTEQSQGEVASN